MPEAVFEILIVASVVVVAVVLHAFFQRRVDGSQLRKQNDVAGYLFSAVGVIYAVVLGFVVVVVWEKYDATGFNVDQESAAVSDLYRAVIEYPQPLRTRIRAELAEYANDIITIEWPLMDRRVDVPRDLVLLETLAANVDGFAPKTLGQSNAQQLATTQLIRLLDARRQRLIQSEPSVPLVLWVALVLGALAMLFFAFLFGVENRPTQLVMTAVLAGLIAMLFIVIWEFDNPFTGSVKISADGWIQVRNHLAQIP
ncbi:MAG TPA: DUF4239 domain-containing protein [Verrucomicrobiae bacterium]|nr:DUF4239 domain-containing protein [Verrucomicrobiae bacterium]